MNKSQLALFGGAPLVHQSWPETNTIGEEEKKSVLQVLDSGVLSGFRATAGDDFVGGPMVRQLEKDWAAFYGMKYAISFNSLTSGLFAAVGAVGVGPGDEVIVSPFTMSASATCAIPYGAVPVFADIDPNTYCLDPKSIAERITPRTKAIVIVHIFGYPADMDAIMEIAAQYNLMVIEDCAQAPAGKHKGNFVGSFGHIGGFSLNYHKTIHSGEGGVMVTNDDDLALRLRLIRNHGEVIVDDLEVKRIANTFGGNTRMTELEAAVAMEQLKKLDFLTDWRIRLAGYLDEKMAAFSGITPQKLVHTHDKHVYYFYVMRYDAEVTGIPRDAFVKAVCAEGIDLHQGYVRPIYWEPIYQQKIAYSKNQYPFESEFYDAVIEYPKGLCPVVERVHADEIIHGKFCRWPLSEAHLDQVVAVFEKVLAHSNELVASGVDHQI
ncbi:MAG: DegT/DnrJ/EryC1/StrS family aminotransferase [Chloroflexi bacterium]|jgi:perosamine synthetase|nr:DegT/DnrJ/EryC1/StrS family aminotransferase [Chloroflexota bacterium]